MSRKIENKGEVLAWSMYDFANQPFTNLVVTFVYGTFFTTVIASNEIVGTQQWSHAISITAIIVALLSPLMGGPNCRYEPTCSNYFIASIKTL